MVLGPLVVLLAGWSAVATGLIDPIPYLIAYPFVALGLVGAVLAAGRAAAEAWQRGQPPPPMGRDVLAYGALAAIAMLLAATISVAGPGTAMALSSGVGLLIPFGLVHLPRAIDPVWVLSPLAVVGGAAGALLWAAFSAVLSVWGGSGAGAVELLVVWLFIAALALAALGSAVGQQSGNRMTSPRWRRAALLTALGCVACWGVAAAVLPL